MLTISRKDILEEAKECDAIVNAANDRLERGGGVCGIIFGAAGFDLDKECESIGGCKTGEAVVTGGYDLPCKYVVHAVGPRYGSPNGDQLLASAYESAIKKAREAGIRSIAFPLISSGIYGYPKDLAEEIAIKALAMAPADMDIRLIIRKK